MSDIFDKLRERKATVAEQTSTALAAITKDFAPLEKSFDGKLRAILSANEGRRGKMIKLQKLVSEVRDLAAPHTACHHGCSNCCYQRVMISQTEADAMGHKIGRPALQLSPRHKIQDVKAFGRETPCPFLEAGACSIYEHRPFACRNLVNLDQDNLLCSLENWELQKAGDPLFTGIPMLGGGVLVEGYKSISSADVIGDIRDFFPQGRK